MTETHSDVGHILLLGITHKNKDSDYHAGENTLFSLTMHAVEESTSILLSGIYGVYGCRALLWVIRRHEDEYPVRPTLIRTDNCTDLSYGDDGWDKCITQFLCELFSDLFSVFLNGVI